MFCTAPIVLVLAPVAGGPPNPIALAIEAKRLEYEEQNLIPQPGELIEVALPAGSSEGISIQDDSWGWTPLTEVDPWWGPATLSLLGHPAGTIIEPIHDLPWGQSLAVFPGDGWEGRVHFRDLTIQASGNNAVLVGHYGTQSLNPLFDVSFFDCSFVDHPNPDVRCLQPVSANQTQISFYRCTWNLPNSIEHAVYNRNPLGLCVMEDCVVLACGAQVWQEVSRPSEGPFYPGGVTTLRGNHFEGYHRDPSRSGSAITLAGTGRDFWMIENVVLDVDRPQGEESHGGFVAWDGEEYWSFEGVAVHEGETPPPGVHANGDVVLLRNLFVHKNPDRGVVKADSCRSFVMVSTGAFCDRGVEVVTNVDDGAVLDAGIDVVLFGLNNRPAHFDMGLQEGVDPALLIDPDLLLFDHEIGHVSDVGGPVFVDL